MLVGGGWRDGAVWMGRCGWGGVDGAVTERELSQWRRGCGGGDGEGRVREREGRQWRRGSWEGGGGGVGGGTGALPRRWWWGGGEAVAVRAGRGDGMVASRWLKEVRGRRWVC